MTQSLEEAIQPEEWFNIPPCLKDSFLAMMDHLKYMQKNIELSIKMCQSTDSKLTERQLRSEQAQDKKDSALQMKLSEQEQNLTEQMQKLSDAQRQYRSVADQMFADQDQRLTVQSEIAIELEATDNAIKTSVESLQQQTTENLKQLQKQFAEQQEWNAAMLS